MSLFENSDKSKLNVASMLHRLKKDEIPFTKQFYERINLLIHMRKASEQYIIDNIIEGYNEKRVSEVISYFHKKKTTKKDDSKDDEQPPACIPDFMKNEEMIDNIINKVVKKLGCSYEFIYGKTNYVYNKNSDEITCDEFQKLYIFHNLIGERIQTIIAQDNIDTNIMFNDYDDKQKACLKDGTNDLFLIKDIAERLNCSWQYLAGLTNSRFEKDILFDYSESENLERIKIWANKNKYLNKESPQMMFLTSRLKKHRTSTANLDQDDVAVALNVSRQYYSKYETGDLNLFSNLNNLSKIANILNCTPQYLLGMTDDPTGLSCYTPEFKEYIKPVIISEPINYNYNYDPKHTELANLFKKIADDKDLSYKTIKILREILSAHKDIDKAINILKILLSNNAEKDKIIKVLNILYPDNTDKKQNKAKDIPTDYKDN